MRSGNRSESTRDIDLRVVLLGGAAIMAMVMGSLAVVAVLDGVLSPRKETDSRAVARRRLGRSPGMEAESTRADELDRLRAEEDAILGGYGWVDEHEGVFRMPIERAMELVAREGLPARAREARPGGAR